MQIKPQQRNWRVRGSEEQLQVHAYNLARAQAKYRHETWSLSLQEFLTLWEPYWHQRGRGTHNMCLYRVNPNLGWTGQNVAVVPRFVQLARQGYYRNEAELRAQEA